MKATSWLLFGLINLVAYVLWGYDKYQATHQPRNRISEATLLAVALGGGWIGAKVGQRHFRHKTRKEPFRTYLNFVPVVWMGLGLWLGPVGTLTFLRKAFLG